MHTSQSCRYLRETPGEHTTSQRRTEFSRRKLSEIRMFLHTKIRLGEIFSRKNVLARNIVKIKNPQMIQLNRIQLTS